MKKLQRLVLNAIFLASIGAVGFAVTQLALPVPALAGSCPPTCVFSQGCPGTLCTCTLDQQTNSYYCKPPVQ